MTTDSDDIPSPQAAMRAAVTRELVARGGLHEFIRQYWSLVDPNQFSDNWHVGAIAEYLESLVLGERTKLVINVPPGHSKSLNCGVFFPAWLWTLQPGARLLYGSFDQSLLNNQSEKLIQLIQSPEYSLAYGEHVQLANDKPALREFKLTSKGFRFNTSPGGKGTGRHVDGLVIDDPLKPDEAVHERSVALKKVINWYNGTLSTRVKRWKLIIMQRLHSDDLAGYCINQGYDTLILPARQVKRTMWARDPRKEIGELLWPEVYGEERVQQLESDLDLAGGQASAQLQQDPTPATGGFIEEPWTRLEWIEAPTKGTFVQSWDFSSKSAQESHSKVSGQLWVKCHGRDIGAGGFVREYLSSLDDRLAKIQGCLSDVVLRKIPEDAELFVLLDFVGGHWNYIASKAQFRMAQDRPGWKQARIKLIELKANGIPLVEEFKDAFIGVKGIEPEGDKEERLRVHTEKWEVGQVIYPPGAAGRGSTGGHSNRYLLRADEIREEHIKFPRYSWDDHVDTSTQALDRLAGGKTAYRENLRIIAARGSR